MKNIFKYIGNFLWNIALLYFFYFLTRLIFVFDNWETFNYLTLSDLLRLCKGGLMFDTAAIAYANILYILLVFFPFHLKEKNGYYKFVKILFVVVNMLMLAVNLIDTGYFPFSKQRLTVSVFSQFSNENNLAGILIIETLRSWYLLLAFVVMSWGLWKLYRTPSHSGKRSGYYLMSFVCLAIFSFASICGMRGGIGKSIRPITIGNATEFTKRPAEAAVVLNSPFSFLRTFGDEPFVVPSYFTDRDQMLALYSPLHLPTGDEVFKPMNVIQIMLESNSMEYYGRGMTPFLDSLMAESFTSDDTFANGTVSIDAMSSILSSIPRMGESFMLTTSALNQLTSAAGELGKHKGYHTAFFHGAQEKSMGFKAYSFAVGYKEYYSRENYGNDADFDGHWSIWDEEFLQYSAEKIKTFSEPFAATVFTATSHHPYIIPDKYMDIYEEGALPIHKCIAYTDMSVRRFFEAISSEPWYDNTLFVLCADHTNIVEIPEYGTDAGRYRVPIMFYVPDGSLKKKVSGIMQQIDVMPTILGLLGYDRPYVAFGNDLTKTAEEKRFAINCNNGIYQLFKDGYLLQFDGEKPIALYEYTSDKMLANNLLGTVECQEQMLQLLKSIVQQYMERVVDTNGLVADVDNITVSEL